MWTAGTLGNIDVGHVDRPMDVTGTTGKTVTVGKSKGIVGKGKRTAYATRVRTIRVPSYAPRASTIRIPLYPMPGTPHPLP